MYSSVVYIEMSAWLEHVKKTMKANPSKKLKEVLKIASKSFKKKG